MFGPLQVALRLSKLPGELGLTARATGVGDLLGQTLNHLFLACEPLFGPAHASLRGLHVPGGALEQPLILGHGQPRLLRGGARLTGLLRHVGDGGQTLYRIAAGRLKLTITLGELGAQFADAGIPADEDRGLQHRTGPDLHTCLHHTERPHMRRRINPG